MCDTISNLEEKAEQVTQAARNQQEAPEIWLECYHDEYVRNEPLAPLNLAMGLT